MTNLSSDNLQLAPVGARVKLASAVVGIIGVVASVLLYRSVTPAHFFRAYLVAFWVILAISLGGLIFVLIHFAVRAGWSTALRRLWEVLASNLRWLWVLFIPIAMGMWFSSNTHLYEWAIPAVVEHDGVLQSKAGFLAPGFWMLRAVVYFAIWGGLAHYYLRQSTAQDESGSVECTYRMQRLAPVAVICFALTISLAAIDWVMSLSPHWFSTIFGVYFFAASACAFFAALILLVYFLQRAGKLQGVITLEHYQDMGKLLFAFGVVFWAYIAYSQFMLIWYANLPEETTWYLIRSLGGWWGVSLLLLLGHFVFPFLFLCSKHTKRAKPVLAAAAGWMLLMVVVDFYWLIMPMVPTGLLHEMQANLTMDYQTFVTQFQEEPVGPETAAALGFDAGEAPTYVSVYGFSPHAVDVTWLLGLGGLYLAATLHTLGRYRLIPVQDPRLDESLAFENM